MGTIPAGEFKKGINFHMVGLECNLGADCKYEHTPSNKMNTTKHETILKRQLTENTVFLIWASNEL